VRGGGEEFGVERAFECVHGASLRVVVDALGVGAVLEDVDRGDGVGGVGAVFGEEEGEVGSLGCFFLEVGEC
jgi:hypothetical protein